MPTAAPFPRRSLGQQLPVQKQTAEHKAKKKWALRSFIVKRRGDGKIPTYRSIVYTPVEEAADLGIGLSQDEVARRVRPRFWDGVGASKKVTSEELSDFWENLGVTVEGGGTEAAALTRATRMAKTARMRGVLGVLRYRLDKGLTLHEGLREFPEVFVKAHCALAEAAIELTPDERSALYRSLGKTIADKHSRSRRFLSTMLDQIITGIMLFIVTVITLVVFAPNYATMFQGMDVKMPKYYSWAANTGKWIGEHGLVALTLFVGFLIAATKVWTWSMKTRGMQRFLARLYIVGPVVRSLGLANSLPLFAVLHKAGVSTEAKFRLTGQASGNALIEDFFLATYEQCAAGMEMEKAFLTERLMIGLDEGRRLAGKVEAGGELGNLEGVLGGLAKEFAEVATSRIEALPKVLKPLNMLIMGMVISGVAALVGLPSMIVLQNVFDQQNKETKERMAAQQKAAIHGSAVPGKNPVK